MQNGAAPKRPALCRTCRATRTPRSPSFLARIRATWPTCRQASRQRWLLPMSKVAWLTASTSNTRIIYRRRSCNTSCPQSFTVTRGPYYFPPLDSRVLPDGVAYLRLAAFVISGTSLPNGTELLADLDRRLDDFDAQGVQSLILDLRNNGGGSLQTTDELLGRFLPDTARSVHELDQRGHETFELAGGRMHARQLPMAVLINGGSA